MKRKKTHISQIKPKKSKIAVLVEGETEICYLEMLQKNEENLQFSIEPKLPQKKSIKEQYEKAISLLKEGYQAVFWIIDFDVILSDNQVKNFLKYLQKAKQKKILTIINNPCLEYWFLLHFRFTQKTFRSCRKAEEELKKYIKDYEKTKKYFINPNQDIYAKLKEKLLTAIENSKKSIWHIENESLDWTASSFSEMYLLFEYIKQYKE
ncbi:RloB family protein [Raineya sp.]|jgi:hypothetical protein